MKYVIFEQQIEDSDQTLEIPVIFPAHLSHEAIAKALLSAEGMENSTPIAAGFCNAAARCRGFSATLNLHSRGDRDSQLISTYTARHGLGSRIHNARHPGFDHRKNPL